ncbi:hypothetical protein LTR92_001749 [Exophiala xenobiotica]|nr:hypothetical protein LTR92_001749 [Exophiala xenobiotica]KAK5434927.1 hypothetical protein LTR18_010026 [Exophiala xenobiotica]KAK5554642.1 hypothetical protein LTR46_007368 [Exophiala xenobiotica]
MSAPRQAQDKMSSSHDDINNNNTDQTSDPTSFRAESPLFVPETPSPPLAASPDLGACNAFVLNTDLVLVARGRADPSSFIGPVANESDKSDGNFEFNPVDGKTTPEMVEEMTQAYTAISLPPPRPASAPPSAPSRESTEPADDEDSASTSSNEASPPGRCDLSHPYELEPWEGMTFAEMQDLMDRQKRQFDDPAARRPAYHPPPNFGDVVREETKRLEEKRARRQKRAGIKAAKKRKDDAKDAK